MSEVTERGAVLRAVRRDRITLRELWAVLREDRQTHRGHWSSPGFQALAVQRFGVWTHGLPGPLRRVLSPLYRLLQFGVRTVHGIELPWRTVVGRGVRLVHHGGIVVHPNAMIGDECVIRHNVTIGAATMEQRTAAPRLGRGVEVGVGAVLLGDIVVGDGVQVGPYAVVMTSVPPGATVTAGASRIVQPPGARPAGRPARPAPRADREEAPR